MNVIYDIKFSYGVLYKKKLINKINPDFGLNRIFFIRIINWMKTAKSGYPGEKKNPDQSGLIRIRVEALYVRK